MKQVRVFADAALARSDLVVLKFAPVLSKQLAKVAF